MSMEDLNQAAAKYLSASPVVKVVTEDSLLEEQIDTLGTLEDIMYTRDLKQVWLCRFY